MQETVVSVRMPKALRDLYKERAASEQRSMNAQLVRALQQASNRWATAKKENA
jgi:hypothetical protein